MDAIEASAGVRTPPDNVPALDIDPFAPDFLHDPFPAYAALRDAAPVVWLSRWSCYGAARHAEVQAILNDPQTFCSSRGVGLADFAREEPWRPPSLILEADPPAHARPRGVLGQVLSIGALRAYKPTFAAVADRLVEALLARGTFDGIADLAEAFPMAVFPDAIGPLPRTAASTCCPTPASSSTRSVRRTRCARRRSRARCRTSPM